MATTGTKVLIDPEIGEVVLKKSARSRRVAIRVHPVRGVTVSVPTFVPYAAAIAFFKLKREWVLDSVRRQKDRLKDAPAASPSEIEELRRQAKSELPPRLAELAKRYGFIYNKVTIKHNSSNWGSCSARGNINLNLNIVRLPSVLRDYVLLHELCHLRHHDHGHAFHLLLEHVLTDNLLSLLPDSRGGDCSEHDRNRIETNESLSSDENRVASAIARKAAASKAKYPLDYTFTRAIRSYRLI